MNSCVIRVRPLIWGVFWNMKYLRQPSPNANLTQCGRQGIILVTHTRFDAYKPDLPERSEDPVSKNHCILAAPGPTWVQLWRALAEIGLDASAGFAGEGCAQLWRGLRLSQAAQSPSISCFWLVPVLATINHLISIKFWANGTKLEFQETLVLSLGGGKRKPRDDFLYGTSSCRTTGWSATWQQTRRWRLSELNKWTDQQ
ncbi:hypothetical protein B0H13DRAFT_2273957 [Mycena leptocephala]|nr:hypothetical protein B0H13DRAFT_2273957 [Mycena leptocephala]